MAREWLEMQPKADKGKDKEQSFAIISEAYLASLEKQEKKESAVSSTSPHFQYHWALESGG
jgi:hypothetical protein